MGLFDIFRSAKKDSRPATAAAEAAPTPRATDPVTTELEGAVRAGNLEKVQELVSKGAELNGQDEYGWLLLDWAACKGYAEVVEYLIEHGANVNARSKNGSPLRMAAGEGRTEIALMLLRHGADPDWKHHDNTPAEWALRVNHRTTAAAIREFAKETKLKKARGFTL